MIALETTRVQKSKYEKPQGHAVVAEVLARASLEPVCSAGERRGTWACVVQPQALLLVGNHLDVYVILPVHMLLANQESFLSQTVLPTVAGVHTVTPSVLVASPAQTPVPTEEPEMSSDWV